MIVAAPALVEAYAVLTRLPPPHRISPEAALTLLDNNFVKSVTVIALTAKTYEALLRLALEKGVAGGRTYDAVIGRCAEQGFDGSHLQRWRLYRPRQTLRRRDSGKRLGSNEKQHRQREPVDRLLLERTGVVSK